MSDGAAAAVVMSLERAQALGITPLARYVSFATAGYKPEEMGLGPVFAIPKALKLAGLKLADIDVIELNEAFAAQSLAVIRKPGLIPRRSIRTEERSRSDIRSVHGSQADRQRYSRTESRNARYGTRHHVCWWRDGRCRHLRNPKSKAF